MDWRDEFPERYFASNDIAPIGSKSLVLGDAQSTGATLDHYFLEDGHPSSPYVKVICEQIMSRL
ncbi:MAG: hypothetical protein OSB41_05545, partial [Kiritimatiellae bacterium]|nr:hypothetical protein [Kiritimatiellia bacterium]